MASRFPKSPEWEGELELGSASEDEGTTRVRRTKNDEEGLEDHLKQVKESPPWVWVRALFSRRP